MQVLYIDTSVNRTLNQLDQLFQFGLHAGVITLGWVYREQFGPAPPKSGSECYGYYKTIIQYTGTIIFKTKSIQFNIK